MATARRWPPAADDVIEAFRRWLNHERHATYEVVERPDTKEEKNPASDYVLRDRATANEIAVAVSSIWRSKDAGKEDAYLSKWFDLVRARVAGRLPGIFYITLAIRAPTVIDPGAFGEALVETIRRNKTEIAALGCSGKPIPADVARIEVSIFQPSPKTGSDIDYARTMPDMSEFPERVKTCLDEKAPKSKQYSERGIENWIVIYNTMGVRTLPFEAERITREQCGALHEHVTHIALVAGMPPDDVWVTVVR